MLPRMPAMNVSRLVAIMLWSALCVAQEVHVSHGKDSVSLSVVARQPYQLLSGEGKMPVLSVECIHKGKKSGHVLKFSPGGSLAEDNFEVDAKPGQMTFNMTIAGTKEGTPWAPYGDTVTFAYLAKTDADRLQFIQSLLNSGMVSIEFNPFLTGVPTTSVFDLSKLRDEIGKYPECAAK